MTSSRRFVAVVAVLLCGAASPAHALPTVAEATRGFEKRDGFLPLHWDAGKGRLLVEIPNDLGEFLYLTSVPAGVGEPRLGTDLDRGATVAEGLARFERVGPRVHLVLRNLRWRASGSNAALARSVEESVPHSTLGAYEVIGEGGGRIVADLTPLFLSDAADAKRSLKSAGLGSYTLDRERSRIHLERTRAFPANSEIEAALTFTSDEPGDAMRGHAPDARAITVRQHHSFVKLPPAGYSPRRLDPRIGAFAITFDDVARPFDTERTVRWIARHRLQKRDAAAAVSAPVEPIVYYLDPAFPEPYRRAFREGAAWWNRVFEAAGFRDAFRVEDLRADMDPMDARWNVILWMHRSGPGPSVGPSFVDPRTGEILKAVVRMDSHRSLVNYDLWAALQPAMGGDVARRDGEAESLIVARRRQHAAHEVGHTLGFSHNFAAAHDGRASVMSYPGALVRLVNGAPDLSDAYRDGPGAWDSLLVRYAYTPFAAGEEERGLDAIVAEAKAKGLRFVTNPDESPDGPHPAGTVWVNGRDPVDALPEVVALRRLMVDRFDERAIAPGEPLATLGRRYAQAYLHHAFALSAAIKAVGGIDFDYAVRGDDLPAVRPVPAERQRRALALALDALAPRELATPPRVVAMLPPTPNGYDTDPRSVALADGAFDPLALARALSTEVLGHLLDRSRIARLAALNAADAAQPSPEQVIATVIDRLWKDEPREAGEAALHRVVQRTVVDRLLALAADREATPESRAAALWGLERLTPRLDRGATSNDPATRAHHALARLDLRRFLADGTLPASAASMPRAPRMPWPGEGDCGTLLPSP